LPGWNWVNVLPEHAARAVRYIEEMAKAEPRKPFFLYLPLTAPHYPVVPDPPLRGQSNARAPLFLYPPPPAPHYPVVPDPQFRGQSSAGDFGDFVAQTDAVVGRVLDA